MTDRKLRIGLYDRLGQRNLTAFFAVLARVYAIEVEPGGGRPFGAFDAVVLVGESRARAREALLQGAHCFCVVPEAGATSGGMGGTLTFGDSAVVPKAFRGASLPLDSGTVVSALLPRAGDEVLAAADERAVWLRESVNGVTADVVAVPPPWSEGENSLVALCQEKEMGKLVPLLHFLKRLLPECQFDQPTQRACVMFDDPNLHWWSYGYVNYRKLAVHADEFNYHASFATVPLDGWYFHRGTCNLFRTHADRLSLLVHGNNHTHSELLGGATDQDRIALLAEAARRVKRLELRSGVRVSKVMAAPHGACSEAMMSAMARLGFEAACISAPSLRYNNPGKEWTRELGLRMSECVAGLPILPRFGITWPGWRAAVRMAAFLDQPIIAVGHHDLLSNGLEPLERFAEFVNSLGATNWMDMTTMVRSNYLSRREGDCLHVRVYSRNTELEIPAGVREVRLEWPWPVAESDGPVRIQSSAGSAVEIKLDPRITFKTQEGTRPTITVEQASPVDPGQVASPPRELWAMLRRPLVECRDRIVPVRDRLRGRVRSAGRKTVTSEG